MSKDRLEPKKSNIRKISRKVKKENETRIKELVPMMSKLRYIRPKKPNKKRIINENKN